MKDVKFWKDTQPKNIAAIYQVYRMDFELFDYSPTEYFTQIGLPEKAREVERILRRLEGRSFLQKKQK